MKNITDYCNEALVNENSKRTMTYDEAIKYGHLTDDIIAHVKEKHNDKVSLLGRTNRPMTATTKKALLKLAKSTKDTKLAELVEISNKYLEPFDTKSID